MTQDLLIAILKLKKSPFILLFSMLSILVGLGLESNCMNVVEQELIEQLDSAGNKPVSVIITCQSKCDAVLKALEDAGVRILSTESMVLGSIAAEITKDQLSILQSVAGISAIECDREVRALE